MKITIWAMLLLISIASTSYAQNGNQRGAHDIDAKTKAEVLKVLDDYMNTFNAKNLTAWEATYQFPHYRLASGSMSVLDKAGLRDSASVFVPLQKAGWHHSRWDHRNIVQASDTKVHVDTRFSRFKADGTKLGEYESLYVLTKENGRWGVKLRSSYAE
ncbi:hypothetical protein [Chryseolinea lacunae]|uniref:Nuclear transport factor 2 family protein n=1 Tax=Chryseolinea lacunae TaxID=2801331 RepID=A0ABS1KTF1_9BACT|nr:hypothetical protein [Chryseolinea lacunae]MBL0742706.1 hypothetical protein [Chryseolinea lacunae]